MRGNHMTLTLLALTLLGTTAILLSAPTGRAEADAPDGPLAVGTKAPGFRLNDQHGKAVSLKSAGKGRWVALAFYPKSATPG